MPRQRPRHEAGRALVEDGQDVEHWQAQRTSQRRAVGRHIRAFEQYRCKTRHPRLEALARLHHIALGRGQIEISRIAEQLVRDLAAALSASIGVLAAAPAAAR